MRIQESPIRLLFFVVEFSIGLFHTLDWKEELKHGRRQPKILESMSKQTTIYIYLHRMFRPAEV